MPRNDIIIGTDSTAWNEQLEGRSSSLEYVCNDYCSQGGAVCCEQDRMTAARAPSSERYWLVLEPCD